MRYFKVLETENTKDFCVDLIDDIFQEIENDSIEYIKLDTCDGELLFAANEVEEIIL